MVRRYNPDNIPDIETLVADGRFVDITIYPVTSYPEGRWTLGEINSPTPTDDDTA